MPQTVPTAQRALQVFEVFAHEGRPLTNSELARQLNLADSSCSDLLFTLRDAGYLVRMPKSRYFYPTTRLNDLSRRIAATDPIQTFVAQALKLLTKRTGESSMCGHLDGTSIKIFACQESFRSLRYVLRPGTKVGVHSTALGKAILGAMPLAERDVVIDQLPMEQTTPFTLEDRDVLKREIESGIERGWFIAREEGAEGVTALGIAGNISGRLTAFSVVGPTLRLEKNITNYAEAILDAQRDFF
ncbi:MAG: IclR family transcriptional regulator [Burkholderiaceae bacterium]|jgi:DNA-binding IclR family transcriptional regulator|nr:IclR family transcriptional regulator [Burkholderiaceae bacterium]